MKEFNVLVSYEVGGRVKVKANNQEEAEEKALERVNEEGESAIWDTTHRDYFTC